MHTLLYYIIVYSVITYYEGIIEYIKLITLTFDKYF